MPDPIKLPLGQAAAAGIAIVLLLVGGWPWRAPCSRRLAVGSVLGVGLGFLAGTWIIGVVVHWPPREDQDRLMFVVMPAAIIVELIAAVIRVRGTAWILRCLMALGVSPILLYNTSYITDLNGPGSREWTPAQSAEIFGGLGGALIVVWALLARLINRAPGRSAPFAISIAAGAAAISVMLSGYGSGGQIGFPLAAAVLGAAIGSLALKKTVGGEEMIGVGLIGVFSLLVMGRFFGQLPTLNGALILLGLLACWAPELPPLGRAVPRVRGAMRIVLTAVPLLIAVFLAGHKFYAEAKAAQTTSNSPSADDYLNYK